MKIFNYIFMLSLVLLSFTACEDLENIDGDFHTTNNVEDWRDEIIYQLMVDRFADGDIGNNYNVRKTVLTAWHGGDYQGVIDKIPYLKKLGVTALWISPVVRNVDEDAGIAGYHGYWTQNFLEVNQHFGDLAKLREMVDKLHAAGIKVILDIVANHIGQLFYYDMNKNGNPDEMVMGSDMDCSTYCSRIVAANDDPNIASGMCDSEYSHSCNTTNDCYTCCVERCNNGYPEKIGMKRYSEWDPDFDPRGIKSFSEAGESGDAPLRWIYMPSINRIPPYPPEFQNDTWYNRKGRIVTWNSPYQVVKGDFPGGLKDLNTAKPEVQAALIDVYKYWIKAIDIDGFRIDTIKHVEHEFWQKFSPAMREYAHRLGKKNFLIFGEAFDGDDELLASFTHNEEMDSVFYFSQKFQVFDSIFKYGGATDNFKNLYNLRMQRYNSEPPRIPTEATAGKVLSEQEYIGPSITDADGNGIPSQQLLVNFMDNHDLPRFLYEKKSQAALRNALSLMLTMDGIPCIYYGTEQNYSGGNDPANRENLAASGYNTTNDTFTFISKMTALRKKYAPLRRGSMNILMTEAGPGILAFERLYKGDVVVVVINTKDDEAVTASNLKTSVSAGKTLYDIAPTETTGTEYSVGNEGAITVTVPARSIKVLVTSK